MKELIKKIPKAELHIHIEGSLEPELMFKLAQRNNVKIPYKTIEDLKNAYNFTNLQSFLDIYYSGAEVLIKEEDFFELTYEYFKKCLDDNIVYVEIFFDPQTHLNRGVSFETVFNGINKACLAAKKNFKIDSKLIMCFLRHLSCEDALKTLKLAENYKEHIVAIGLDSSELNNPPSKFKKVFEEAKKQGYLLVAHAGEEAGADYIYEALDVLKVNRIDHGVQAIQSKKLLKRLKEENIPLTVCPNSNIELKVFNKYSEHNIKKLLDYGLNVSINSDDPAYFKGYINSNFINVTNALELSKEEILKLIINSFNSAFITQKEKEKYINKAKQIVKAF